MQIVDCPLLKKSLQEGFPSGETGCYGLAKLVVSETAHLFGDAVGVETVTLIPGNIYGPSDHFECNRSHVVAAVLRRAVVSQLLGQETFSVWGNGSATRDFVYVDDVARTIAQASYVRTSLFRRCVQYWFQVVKQV